MAAEEDDDLERVNGLLCGAVRVLRGQRAKPDQLLYLALMFLAKSKSYIFSGKKLCEIYYSIQVQLELTQETESCDKRIRDSLFLNLQENKLK